MKKFDEYVIQGGSQKQGKGYVRQMSIGMQTVDGLEIVVFKGVNK